MTRFRTALICIAALSVACSMQSPRDPVAGGSERCPPCPAGTYCASDVMVKDLATGKIVCYPTYCVPGPDPFCNIDPDACTTSSSSVTSVPRAHE